MVLYDFYSQARYSGIMVKAHEWVEAIGGDSNLGITNNTMNAFLSILVSPFSTFHKPAGFFLLAAPFLQQIAVAQTVDLGAASGFAVLAASGITNTGLTTITGDVGSYPTATITGFESVTLVGTNHGGDSTTQAARASAVTAYGFADGLTPTTTFGASYDLGGDTLAPGVYYSDDYLLNGNLVLDGGGNPNATWVFQSGTTLTTGSASQVLFINGAQASNVVWQLGTAATLGSGSVFGGTILAASAISLDTGATINGRAFAGTAVTLIGNTITSPIPEASSFLLLGSGLITVLFVRRRTGQAGSADAAFLPA